ncbi:hypothetical protein L218DRAFT_585181 [Marasmius fiardii PR-910]|nr:hypothetical protein L218DRAFT_585181 [Marasmius fiardii PR-910]
MLPLELVHHILNFTDKRTLPNCSLVHSSWRFYGQQLLFRTLSFGWAGRRPPDNSFLVFFSRAHNIASLDLGAFEFRNAALCDCIQSLLPSLTSLRISYSIISRVSPGHFFLFTSNGSTLKSLEFHHLTLDSNIPSPTNLTFPPPRSIHLTHLALEFVRPLSLFNAFFSASHCPFVFQSLNCLHFSGPYEQDTLTTLVRIVGSNLTILRLDISPAKMPEWSCPLLTYTPRLKSFVFLENQITDSENDWTHRLFPFEGMPTLEKVSIKLLTAKHTQCRTLVSSLSSRTRFPGLRRISLILYATTQETRERLAADFNAGTLGGDERLVLTSVDHHDFWP